MKQSIFLVVMLIGIGFLSYFLRKGFGRIIRREWLFYFFLMPGTIVHEASHLIISLILLVPVSEVHFFRIEHQPDGSVNLGEVVHADVDPIRNFLIGIAPIAVASGLIYFLSATMLVKDTSVLGLLGRWETYIFLIATFLIGLGLCPSRQDLKGLIGFILVAGVLGVGVYFIIKAVASTTDLTKVGDTIINGLKTLNSGLLLVVIIMALLTGAVWILKSGIRGRRY